MSIVTSFSNKATSSTPSPPTRSASLVYLNPELESEKSYNELIDDEYRPSVEFWKMPELESPKPRRDKIDEERFKMKVTVVKMRGRLLSRKCRATTFNLSKPEKMKEELRTKMLLTMPE
ncbi:hypothetical protein FBU30_000377 [Linnemannia zychae]|nr:hypothetical protein FBU30_000377 [Linnemannia zychae]